MKIDFKNSKLSCCMLIISLLICFWIAWNYRELFTKILSIKPSYVIILLILFMLVQMVNGYRIFIVVRYFGLKIKTIDWIGLPYLTSYLNYLPVNAGSGVTAMFLKKKYGLPYTKFVSISGALFLLQLFCFSTLGLLLIGLIRINEGNINNIFIIVLIFILSFTIASRFVPLGFIKGQSRLSCWFRSTLKGFEDFRKDKSLLLSLILNYYLQLALMGLAIYFTFLSLGLLVNYMDGLLLGIITSVSKYNFLFPGQLGLREILIGFITKIIHGSFDDGVLVAVTDRVISGVATIIIGNIFLWMVIYRLRD